MEILLRLAIIGLGMWAIFSLIILVKAFEESFFQALLVLIVPFYALYYALARMQSERKGLIVGGYLFFALTGPILSFVGPLFISSKACTLVDKAEVEQALGGEIEEPVQSQRMTPFGVIDACVCTTVQAPEKTVLLALSQDCSSLDQIRQEAAGSLLPMENLGDEAYWGGYQMVARQGSNCIYLEVRDDALQSMNRMQRMRVGRKLATSAFARIQ